MGRPMSEAFAERWAIKERECGLDAIASEMVACGERSLPRDAAPCLTFGRAGQPSRVWEVYGAPSDWSDADRMRLASFRVIGSDGAGNPLCLDQGTGAVWLLDHEDRFRTRQFVNGGIPQLAECLLAYPGERDAERFRSAVRAVDPPALAEASFWSQEAEGLEADSDD
jgi:hypothetical protein